MLNIYFQFSLFKHSDSYHSKEGFQGNVIVKVICLLMMVSVKETDALNKNFIIFGASQGLVVAFVKSLPQWKYCMDGVYQDNIYKRIIDL
ncbi:hypothetical protein [Lysinibacillus sp. NPDC056232]|uniref:hypothetical protein n=1 Tax=Lysinibacillus sp. NPDC056232 TaxID=3345756 RepID=UPI0035E18858